MELAVALDPLFEQVVIVGEGRPCLSALIVLEANRWPRLARDLGLDPMRRESLEDGWLLRAVLVRVQRALKYFPGYAKIRRVHLSLAPWTVEEGLITPTLKVKRARVLQRYADEVESMYRA